MFVTWDDTCRDLNFAIVTDLGLKICRDASNLIEPGVIVQDEYVLSSLLLISSSHLLLVLLDEPAIELVCVCLHVGALSNFFLLF